MSLSQNLAASLPKFADRDWDECVTSVSALLFFSRIIYFCEMSLLCLQSVFETKILFCSLAQSSVKLCVCVYILTLSFNFLTWQIEGGSMLQTLESNTWKPNAGFNLKCCSSHAVDKYYEGKCMGRINEI